MAVYPQTRSRIAWLAILGVAASLAAGTAVTALHSVKAASGTTAPSVDLSGPCVLDGVVFTTSESPFPCPTPAQAILPATIAATPSPGLVNYPEYFTATIPKVSATADFTTHLPTYGYVGTNNGLGTGVTQLTTGACAPSGCQIPLISAGDPNTIDWTWENIVIVFSVTNQPGSDANSWNTPAGRTALQPCNSLGPGVIGATSSYLGRTWPCENVAVGDTAHVHSTATQDTLNFQYQYPGSTATYEPLMVANWTAVMPYSEDTELFNPVSFQNDPATTYTKATKDPWQPDNVTNTTGLQGYDTTINTDSSPTYLTEGGSRDQNNIAVDTGATAYYRTRSGGETGTQGPDNGNNGYSLYDIHTVGATFYQGHTDHPNVYDQVPIGYSTQSVTNTSEIYQTSTDVKASLPWVDQYNLTTNVGGVFTQSNAVHNPGPHETSGFITNCPDPSDLSDTRPGHDDWNGGNYALGLLAACKPNTDHSLWSYYYAKSSPMTGAVPLSVVSQDRTYPTETNDIFTAKDNPNQYYTNAPNNDPTNQEFFDGTSNTVTWSSCPSYPMNADNLDSSGPNIAGQGGESMYGGASYSGSPVSYQDPNDAGGNSTIIPSLGPQPTWPGGVDAVTCAPGSNTNRGITSLPPQTLPAATWHDGTDYNVNFGGGNYTATVPASPAPTKSYATPCGVADPATGTVYNFSNDPTYCAYNELFFTSMQPPQQPSTGYTEMGYATLTINELQPVQGAVLIGAVAMTSSAVANLPRKTEGL